jgi:hypothetical protein
LAVDDILRNKSQEAVSAVITERMQKRLLYQAFKEESIDSQEVDLAGWTGRGVNCSCGAERNLGSLDGYSALYEGGALAGQIGE